MRSPERTALHKREVANRLRDSQAFADCCQPVTRPVAAARRQWRPKFPPCLSLGGRHPSGLPQPAPAQAGGACEGSGCQLGSQHSQQPERLPCRCSSLAGVASSPPRSGQGLRGLFFCSDLVGTAQTNLRCTACHASLQCSILLIRHMQCYRACCCSPGFFPITVATLSTLMCKICLIYV